MLVSLVATLQLLPLESLMKVVPALLLPLPLPLLLLLVVVVVVVLLLLLPLPLLVLLVVVVVMKMLLLKVGQKLLSMVQLLLTLQGLLMV
jgi:hypothetical protein